MKEKKLSEEELEHINSDLDQNISSPKINSGLRNAQHNDPHNFIDDPEDFCQYRI